METHILRHRDSETKKPRHRDSKIKKLRHRVSGTKTPRHREMKKNKPRHRDPKVFFQRTKNHDIEIARLKYHKIEIPRPKSHDIEFLWNSNPYDPHNCFLVDIYSTHVLISMTFAVFEYLDTVFATENKILRFSRAVLPYKTGSSNVNLALILFCLWSHKL